MSDTYQSALKRAISSLGKERLFPRWPFWKTWSAYHDSIVETNPDWEALERRVQKYLSQSGFVRFFRATFTSIRREVTLLYYHDRARFTGLWPNARTPLRSLRPPIPHLDVAVEDPYASIPNPLNPWNNEIDRVRKKVNKAEHILNQWFQKEENRGRAKLQALKTSRHSQAELFRAEWKDHQRRLFRLFVMREKYIDDKSELLDEEATTAFRWSITRHIAIKRNEIEQRLAKTFDQGLSLVTPATSPGSTASSPHHFVLPPIPPESPTLRDNTPEWRQAQLAESEARDIAKWRRRKALKAERKQAEADLQGYLENFDRRHKESLRTIRDAQSHSSDSSSGEAEAGATPLPLAELYAELSRVVEPLLKAFVTQQETDEKSFHRFITRLGLYCHPDKTAQLPDAHLQQQATQLHELIKDLETQLTKKYFSTPDAAQDSGAAPPHPTTFSMG